MLVDLQISNFAIIEEQTISFSPGLNVISGETGAGKSIILQAIELILGGRASAQSVREGSNSLEVQAVFDLSTLPNEIRASLPEIARGEELLVSRTVTDTGKGKVFINGKLASVAVLSELVSKIVSLCKQGQQMRLLDREFHTEIIDMFGGLAELHTEYRLAFAEWSKEAEKLNALERRLAEGEARREELLDRIKELSQVPLRPGLRIELEGRLKLLKNSGRLVAGYQKISDALNGEPGVISLMRIVSAEVEKLRQHDEGIGSMSELIETIRAEVLDLDSELADRAAKMDIDEDELQKMEGELAELARLQRKYRLDDAGLSSLLVDYRKELGLIDDAGAVGELHKMVEQLYQRARSIAENLSQQRRLVAAKLSKLVEPELHELNMPGARFDTQFTRTELGQHGLETLELMIATNKGEPLKPLRQVASGGELSRILLVLKKVLQEQSGINVLIFDEIDAGVSGKVARAVGEKLKALSAHSQVLCITHLPQIASLADKHLLVEKQVGKRTLSVVRELNGEEKIEEIARMLAGYQITAASRESAKELLSSK